MNPSNQLTSAQEALEEFVNTLNSARDDLENSTAALEAQSEESAVQKIMESSGDETALLSQQLTKLLDELGEC